MLTIKTVENIKRGAWTTLFNGVYAVLFGIVYLSFFKFILKVNFKAIDVVWQVFAKYNPEINYLFIKLMILKGIFIIAIGILIIYLSDYILRKKDKGSWISLFIIGLIFWASLLAFEILDKNIYTIALVFLGWAWFIAGMLIPIRYYTQRDYGDY